MLIWHENCVPAQASVLDRDDRDRDELLDLAALLLPLLEETLLLGDELELLFRCLLDMAVLLNRSKLIGRLIRQHMPRVPGVPPNGRTPALGVHGPGPWRKVLPAVPTLGHVEPLWWTRHGWLVQGPHAAELLKHLPDLSRLRLVLIGTIMKKL